MGVFGWFRTFGDARLGSTQDSREEFVPCDGLRRPRDLLTRETSDHAMNADGASELFDLYDADGAPLGLRKERALVHRDGDWHRSLHLWVVLAEGPRSDGAAQDPWVLF